ncbi:dienelactone hydrolase family protein [Calothrix sp. PCC 6303]|uniref:dienelactone hydrolase family protein n=1 Tax=Calothrix sp. PCC 6303 TaxID=1170562 RepID=UPI0002A03FA3|nr:dienelactone hydrolase family protein [Calothrix sp. PCC 6303]AFZ00909.1 Carboxymethylenebutenolidase [Calothrix sp. PCC 6303]
MKRRDLLITSAAVASTSLIAKFGTDKTIAAQAVKGKTVTLAEGLEGYYVYPQGKKSAPAVMVFMEAFGLNSYIKEVCDRLARAGYAALAPDFYHGATYNYTDIQNAIAKLKTLNDDTVMSEVGKGLEFLAKRKEVTANKVGVMGFCMGGRYTFLANAVHADKFKGAVAFYGGGIDNPKDQLGRKSLLDQVAGMKAPIMLIYGAEDNLIPPDEHGRIATALSSAKKRYTLTVFPAAGHGFFSDRRDSYVAPAAKEAWQLTMSFFSENLK